MAQGLAVSDVVNVTTTISPIATPTRNFGAGLIVGVTDVIDTTERIRSYSGLTGVANDFGLTDPEYLAAAKFFGQSPQPSLVYIGRFAQSATKGRLNGGVLTASEQLIASWTSISTGSMKISIDGTEYILTGLNFSAALNLSAVAAIIDTALANASVEWDDNSGRFIVRSNSTGATSTVSYASSHTVGTDVSAKLKLTSSAASAPVVGIVAETLVQALDKMADKSGDWYAAIIAASVANDDALAASEYIEGLNKKRVIGYTVQTTTTIDNTLTTDLASVMKAAGYSRTWVQYSTTSPYAIASFFGRMSTVDFTSSDTMLTAKFKQEPGVTAETLTETQASALKDKNCNVFVNYDNDTAIIQEGVMSNGYFFDERHGCDWLEDAIQTAVWNLLYTSTTKVPQTDAGTTRIIATITKVLDQAVTNGMVAPGVWNADGFGLLKSGDTLKKGYYIWAQKVADQSQSDREARKSVPIKIAVKLAGAVHFANIAINVNR